MSHFWALFLYYFSVTCKKIESWLDFFFFEIDIYIIQKQNKMITSSFPCPQIYLIPLRFSEYQPKFCIFIFYQRAGFKGLILAAWNQRSPITSYWLNSAQKFNICLSSKTDNCDQGYICTYGIIQTFKNLKHSEEDRLQTLLKTWTTWSTSVIFNCFVMCKQRTSDHFHTDALKLSDNFILCSHFLLNIISLKWFFLKYMKCFSIILNYLLPHKLRPWSPPNWNS